MNSEPELQRKPLKDEIFEILHKLIIAGKYAPGEWLRKEEIASQLGVSMTPVREALDLLVSAGLAEREPYRGVRVLQLSVEEIVEAYAMRLLLESTAARSAAGLITAEQVSALRRLLEQMEGMATLNEMHSLRLLNREFHLQVVNAAGNSLLSRMYGMVSNAFPDWMLYEAMFRYPELLESSLSAEYEEHRAILEALAAHDPDQAARQALLHILNLGQELHTFLGIPTQALAEKEQACAAIAQIFPASLALRSKAQQSTSS